MSHTAMLSEILILFGTAVVVAWLFRVMRLPSIIGFLITGMIIGPQCGGFVEPAGVEKYSEFGLVLLLFTIGLELSPGPLLRSGKRLFTAALFQVLLIMIPTAITLKLFNGMSLMPALLTGIAVALSSTAIALKQMSDRSETGSSTGILGTGILLFQDVIVIALLLLLSMVSPDQNTSGYALVAKSLGGLVGLVVVVLLARRFLPVILDQVSRHGGRELNTLFAVLAAVAGAWSASAVGWSPALGACIAGLLLAGADQRHQLVAEITPFRDVFNAMFFISLGMSVNTAALIGQLPMLLTAIILTTILKPILTGTAITFSGWPLRIGLQVGIMLCTVSEFSYVCARQAANIGWMTSETVDFLVGYTVGSMILGALLYPFAGPIAIWITTRLQPDQRPTIEDTENDDAHEFHDHVIVVGYGLTGQNLTNMLKATHLPYCVIEMNRGLVMKAQRHEAPVIVGDATRMTILEHAGIANARVVVVAVNDRIATRRIVAQCNACRPELYILARTNFATDIEALLENGARLVIPADFETSIEVAAHVLKEFGVPDNIVEAQIASIRSGGYGLLRGKPTDRASHAQLAKILERTTTQTFYLEDTNYATGKTLAQTNLRALTGCMVIAVVRSGNPKTNPSPDFVLTPNDVLVLVGSHFQIETAKSLLQYGPEPSSETEKQPNL